MEVGRMAELVDALDSKSGSCKGVRVRFPLRPPIKKEWLFCKFYRRSLVSRPASLDRIQNSLFFFLIGKIDSANIEPEGFVTREWL